MEITVLERSATKQWGGEVVYRDFYLNEIRACLWPKELTPKDIQIDIFDERISTRNSQGTFWYHKKRRETRSISVLPRSHKINKKGCRAAKEIRQ